MYFHVVLCELLPQVRVPDVPYYCHLTLPASPAFTPTDSSGGFTTTASDKTTAAVLLPAPHGIRATTLVNLLILHMAWHSRLGVHTYIMYVTEQLQVLQADPRVQVSGESASSQTLACCRHLIKFNEQNA